MGKSKTKLCAEGEESNADNADIISASTETCLNADMEPNNALLSPTEYNNIFRKSAQKTLPVLCSQVKYTQDKE